MEIMDNLNPIILSLILITPLIGAAVIAMLPDPDNSRNHLPRWIALATALLTFVLTLHLPAHFDYAAKGFQFEQNTPWIQIPAIRYHLGVDGLSMWLVVLTGLLAPIGVLASWNTIQKRTKVFYALFLVQQTAMAGVFVALDLMLYYGFWELSLVPMAILIAMYPRTQSAGNQGGNEGGNEGPKAALRFFLYTFIPSAPLLVAILYLYAHSGKAGGSFDYAALQAAIASGSIPVGPLFWLSIAFLIAFAVKVPVLGLHGWLPDTFAEAPIAMAMVVAGKLGLYSLIRFHVGLFPTQAHQAAPWMIALAALGILYGACLALVQKDFWKLLAYGTLSSLSFCTLGIYGFTLTGLDGAVFQTLNEGIIGAAMFVLLGVLYERFGTSQISQYGGLAKKSPALATAFVFTCLAFMGLPLLNGFVGEFLVLSSTFTGGNRAWAVAATVGVILSAAYLLTLVQRIFFGPISELITGHPPHDLYGREESALLPLALLMLIMGVSPNLWLPSIESAFLSSKQAQDWIDSPTTPASHHSVSAQPQGGTH